MFIVIAYDIEDDRRRRHVATLLEEWGVRVEKSVFECLLSPADLRSVRHRIETLTESDDRVRYYAVCARCLNQSAQQGGPEFHTEPLYYLA